MVNTPAARRSRGGTWLLMLGELVALLGAAFCYAGMAMAGSFTISNPEQRDHWRFVATVYQALMGICVVAAIVLLVMLARSRRAVRAGAPGLVGDRRRV
jgi:hypothetical protein